MSLAAWIESTGISFWLQSFRWLWAISETVHFIEAVACSSFTVSTTLFWFPHPIGFIMLINPLMTQLWFSFFLGWLFKKITVKYGGKATFDRVRDVFIGLILGELMAIFFWGAMSLILGVKVSGITLNRYS